jgi:uncharacterized UBP type Zn finger protein
MTTTGAISRMGEMRRVFADEVRRIAFQRSFAHRGCAHPAEIDGVALDDASCPACVERGESWVQLRMCLTCGSVGCCDSTPGTHARAHYDATGHPVIRSIEPGESWAWCYPDQAYLRAT